MLLITSSLIACESVQRPDAMIWGVNGPKKHLKGYNLRNDFDNDGNRKPDAQPQFKSLTGLPDLNAYVCFDPPGIEEIKRYIGELRQYAKDNCK